MWSDLDSWNLKSQKAQTNPNPKQIHIVSGAIVTHLRRVQAPNIQRQLNVSLVPRDSARLREVKHPKLKHQANFGIVSGGTVAHLRGIDMPET